MSTDLVVPFRMQPHAPNDPLSGLWPATLPIELAMRDQTPAEICRAYGIEQEEFLRLGQNPAFRGEVKAAIEALRKEGASFRVRAQMQAVELLKTSFTLIHDKDCPYPVRAKLIEMTIKSSGLDASIAGGAGMKGGAPQSFSITLNLG